MTLPFAGGMLIGFGLGCIIVAFFTIWLIGSAVRAKKDELKTAEQFHDDLMYLHKERNNITQGILNFLQSMNKFTPETVKEIFDNHFCPPFLDDGMVTTRWVDKPSGRVLEIKIGRRDIWIDEKGEVVAAGTTLTDQSTCSVSSPRPGH